MYLVPVTRKIIGADAVMPKRKKEKRESARCQGHLIMRMFSHVIYSFSRGHKINVCVCVCVCVCVFFFPFILDIKFVGRML